jgi:hypothetical protein
MKKITPWQWLLVQLHPGAFFGRDVFDDSIKALFELAKPSQVALLIATFSFSVVDEAQISLERLDGQFQSQTKREGKRASLRGLLSPIVSGLFQSTGVSVILCGTGLSMLEANKTAASAGGSVEDFWTRAFFDFPIMLQDDVEKYLQMHLNLDDDSLNASFIREARVWLSGRRRFTAAFVEKAIARPKQSLQDTLVEYVTEMTTDSTKKSRTILDLLNHFRDRKNVNKVHFFDEKQRPVEVSSVWNTFLRASLLQSHGFIHKIEQAHAPALVEVGLALRSNIGLVPGPVIELAPFEPLVLETCRRNFMNDAALKDWILQGLEPTDKGKRFEFAAPYVLPIRVGRKLALLDESFFPDLSPAASRTLLEARRLPCFNQVLEEFLSKYGRVAISSGETKKTLYAWFDECWQNRYDPESTSTPFAIYPDTLAGPDIAMLVRAHDPEFVLVLFQCKFGEYAEWKESRLTVDPDLLYHEKRGESGQGLPKVFKVEHDEFLKTLRQVPVVRIVLSAKKDFRAVIELIEHGRTGSMFDRDLLIAVSGEDMLNRWFGDELGSFLKNA